MLIGLILGAFFLLLIAMLFWSPLLIWADTRIPVLQVEWKRIATLRLGYEEGSAYIRLKTLFLTHTWAPGSKPAGRRRQKKKRSAHRPRKKAAGWPKKIMRVIKSFTVIRLELSLDTSDPVMNAQLFPLNFFPYPDGKWIHINFLEENYLLLHIRNTAGRMLRAWFSG